MNKIINLENKFSESNFLLITLDSCRWDVFSSAHTPVLKEIGGFKKAFSQGTYTLPSHLSMYQGIFPSTFDDEPYYNRFSKNIYRIDYRQKNVDSIVTFGAGTKNIVLGFKLSGYYTLCIGAVDWFKHDNLTEDFEDSFFTGIDVFSQIRIFKNKTSKIRRPFFSLINVGETHEPYLFGGRVVSSLDTRDRMRAFKNEGYRQDDYDKQVSSLEYIDKKLEELFRYLHELDRPTVVTICGDHGECFGEDGLYGHGFFHLKIMEVPFSISGINLEI